MEKAKQFNQQQSWGEKFLQPQKEEEEDPLFYTLEKQQGTLASLLNFCLTDGSEIAFPLSDMDALKLAPSKEIILFFGVSIIRIQGRNLKALYVQLTRKKVVEIREYKERDQSTIKEQGLVVTGIIISSHYMDDP